MDELARPIVKGLTHHNDTLAVYMDHQINAGSLDLLEGMQARSLAQAAKNAKRMTTTHNVQSLGNVLKPKPPAITKSGVLLFALNTSNMLNNDFEESEQGLIYPMEDAVLRPIHCGGAHFGKITSVQTSMYNDRIFTLGDDGTFRCWEYRQKKFEQIICGSNSIIHADSQHGMSASKIEETVSEDRWVINTELNFNFVNVDRPLAFACHPFGMHAAVLFPDRLRMYQISHAVSESGGGFEIPLKNPTAVTFSTAGDCVAVAAGHHVILVDYWGGQLAHLYSGHLATVNAVHFSADDKLIMSCGADGCVYAWKARNGSERVYEHVSKGVQYTSFALDMSSEEQDMVATTSSGALRLVTRAGDLVALEMPPSSSSSGYVTVLLSVPVGLLIAGLANGCLRIFRWPLPRDAAQVQFADFPFHSRTFFFQKF
jgi:WD40 repeat protein